MCCPHTGQAYLNSLMSFKTFHISPRAAMRNFWRTDIENGGGLRHLGAVKFAFTLFCALTAAVLAGCDKSDSPPAAAPAPDGPTHAQAKLPTMKLYLGPETLDAELALTPDEEQTGMMFRTNILETDSMLFPLPYPMRASFWMKNCPESLSAAYMTPDGVIQEIHHFEKNDTNAVLAARDDIQFVLETKDGWFDRHHIGVGTAVLTEKGPLADVFLK